MDQEPDNPRGGGGPGAPEPGVPRGAQMVFSAVILYALMGGVGLGAAAYLLDGHSALVAPGDVSTSLHWKVLMGAGLGVFVHVLDAILERFLTLFQRMSEAFKEMLGGLTPFQAISLAALSSVGEEIFFRGFLQSWFSELGQRWFEGPWLGLVVASVLFGLAHLPPDKRLWPWPLLAVAMGFGFGALFEVTGDLLAPILAHFTINYFALMGLAHSGDPEATAQT